MVDWAAIESVFLDMDGTLLDLHFDNHFWLSHVPVRYAERHGLPLEAAQADLKGRYARVAGTMQWYCVDYWSEQLDLDIAALKAEVRHLIAVHPHVHDFLAFLRRAGKRIALVTNAHAKSLSLKMDCTGLAPHFDAVFCAHALGLPKEHPEFWGRLRSVEPFVPERTLFIDDSLPVLRSAQAYGIAHLRSVRRPDSRQPPKAPEEFIALADFGELLPGALGR
ncbi:MAG: GMP/IMP nucleotidase [Betaproteobacteria bacterium]|nr:GMP/IMP nucleotidase [Betaproteobacteria bacterium]